MNIIKRHNLAQVVMPLIRVQLIADLSWMDREEVSRAIARIARHWADMEAEREQLNAQNVQQGYQHSVPPISI